MESLWIGVVTAVIAAAITGPAGYVIKALLTRNRYLPSSREDPKAYSFINDEWFFYHFTCDASSQGILPEDRVFLALEKDSIVTGTPGAIDPTRF